MNLTKKQAILILLSTLFFVITSTSVYLLTPYESDTLETSNTPDLQVNDSKTETNNANNDKLSIKTSNNVSIENLQLLDSDSALSAKITVPSDDIYLAASQLFSKVDHKKIKNPKLELLDNQFKISFNYKIIGGFHTSVIVSIKPTIEDNILYLTIPNVSVGKLQLNDKTIDFIVKRILKNNLQKINYKDSTLIIDIKDISSQLRISNFTLNKDNLSVVLIYSFGQSIFS